MGHPAPHPPVMPFFPPWAPKHTGESGAQHCLLAVQQPEQVCVLTALSFNFSIMGLTVSATQDHSRGRRKQRKHSVDGEQHGRPMHTPGCVALTLLQGHPGAQGLGIPAGPAGRAEAGGVDSGASQSPLAMSPRCGTPSRQPCCPGACSGIGPKPPNKQPSSHLTILGDAEDTGSTQNRSPRAALTPTCHSSPGERDPEAGTHTPKWTSSSLS